MPEGIESTNTSTDPKVLSSQVDALAEEMGIKWGLIDTDTRYQIQAALAQAIAMLEVAASLREIKQS